MISIRLGGGSSHERTGLHIQFPDNREKYREFCRISAVKLSFICSCVENSKTWQPNSLRRITGKSQRVSGRDRAGEQRSAIQRMRKISLPLKMTGVAEPMALAAAGKEL